MSTSATVAKFSKSLKVNKVVKSTPKTVAKVQQEVVAGPIVNKVPPKTVVKAVEVKKSSSINKRPKTLLSDGMHYSLLSRVRNAFSGNQQTDLDKGDKLTLIDGRGQEQKIAKSYLAISLALGGAKYLSTVRTSAVRKALIASGTIKVEAKKK